MRQRLIFLNGIGTVVRSVCASNTRQELNTQRSFIKKLFAFEDFNPLNRILNIKERKYKGTGDLDNANRAGEPITG